jgi:hypothetical protein
MSVSVHLPGRLSADGGKIIPLNIDRNQITNILSLIYEYISHTKLYYMWEKQKRSAVLYMYGKNNTYSLFCGNK